MALLFKKVDDMCDELVEFYNTYLVPKYEYDSLYSVEMIAKYLRSENMSAIIGDYGGIIYTPMKDNEILFIQYIAANSAVSMLQLLTVALLDEIASICIINEPAVGDVLADAGFKHINLPLYRPKLAFDKQGKEFDLAVYGTDKVSKKALMLFLIEYYKRIALIPNPEKESSFIQNLDVLKKTEDYICTV